MRIRYKVIINMSLFLSFAVYMGYHELYRIHPDLFSIFDLKMQL